MIVFGVHPAIVTPAMICVTICMIVKLRMRDHAGPRPTSPRPVYREFQTATVAVCIFYVLSQVANLVYAIMRGIHSDKQLSAHYVYALFTYVNSTVNFFIYLGTSSRFRATLIRLWHQSVNNYRPFRDNASTGSFNYPSLLPHSSISLSRIIWPHWPQLDLPNTTSIPLTN